MLIAIPSCGRSTVEKQVTIRSLRNIPYKTVICVPASEARRYRNNITDFEVVEVPDDIKGISDTREWILFELSKKMKEQRVLMLDDDMDFCVRTNGMEDPALTTIKEPKRIEQMLDMLDRWMNEGFIHVGLSARQGNNHFPTKSDYDEKGVARKWRDASRMMNAYAYDVSMLKKLKVNVGRNKVMHDFDLTLQLLRLGYPNRVSFEYCWNQRGSGKTGGCSTYRDAAMQAASAHQLKADHPDFVSVVTKKSKSNWQGMEERVDVTIQWRKAYDSAPKKKGTV